MLARLLANASPLQAPAQAPITDPQLTERQKQVLIEIYESFRRESQPTPPTAEVIAVLREPAEPAEKTESAEPASTAEPSDDRS